MSEPRMAQSWSYTDWRPGGERLESADWTPTGHPEIDEAYGHPEQMPNNDSYGEQSRSGSSDLPE